ncbi:MAG: hypothetical protein QGG54_06020 [Gammaproteobacteria bacterium]|nr:hypothetical protein [Gammaproteobacteria bacterium]MDP6535481.1 hypothetical protein [Gammaproteobacteria bacterium]MDP6733361.1 hypothetical protein [Gammaproteobacteria bacterium]HAJ76093.1 hypothetical protein [Gammaproteobacteria bacterium]
MSSYTLDSLHDVPVAEIVFFIGPSPGGPGHRAKLGVVRAALKAIALKTLALTLPGRSPLRERCSLQPAAVVTHPSMRAADMDPVEALRHE